MKHLTRLMSIVLIAMAAVACSGGSNSPEATVKNYLSFVQKGKIDKALDLVYFKNELTKEDKDQLVQLFSEKIKSEYEKKGGLQSFEIGEATVSEDGNSAKVKYTLKFGNGTTEDDTQKLVKVDGKWLIDSGK